MAKIKNNKKYKIVLQVILILFITVLLFFTINLINIINSVSETIPLIENFDIKRINQSTKIYDREGKILLYEPNAGEKRTIIPFEEIPQHLKNATIATEDEKFYETPGFDWRAIIRALITNIIHGKIVQGGSTITQQLAKNVFLSSEKTLNRKLKEFFIALELNRRFDKDKILWFYLNEISYGPMIYGVESASQNYFGKSVKDLNLAESAILAAIPRAPTYYNPWGNHVDDLLRRQRFILKKMKSLGMIDDQQLEDALSYQIVFQTKKDVTALHFIMMVQDYLIKKYGEDLVQTGGLIVKTTLDYEMQKIAEQAVKEGAERNTKLYQGKNAALVAQDPKTGQILALVGSKDFKDKEFGKFNVATQGLRQPGSALKPFVYLTAFQKGYTPNTIIFDVPTEFVPNNPLCPNPPNYKIDDPQCFHPKNSDNKFLGPINLKLALAQSRNIPAVKMLYLVGLKDSLKILNNFGITTLTDPNRYGLSLVLGGGEIKLIELTQAYSILANDGIKNEQSFILEIKDASGKILEKYENKSSQIIDPNYVRMINDILSDPEARAGLFGSTLNLTIFPGYQVALKTGTTNDYRDAWAFGYTPNLVVGVWAGNNDNRPMQKSGSSILAAIPIWNNFLSQVLPKLQPEEFPKPEIPFYPEKPILNGEYIINNEIHSILYYIDKNNPLGPPPLNPYTDPQFNNWESSVLNWALNNKEKINKDIILFDKPKINIISPKNGTFIDNSTYLQANINSNSNIRKINIYLNNNLINSLEQDFQSNYNLNFPLNNLNLESQNLIEIEAINKNNNSSKASIILYKE
ncbi:MAG: PBP1A family penicillin-binding protein [Patescibacteria group bacterium]|nr:PBP1A family penicillin-binding protein [Patescibacteria group bacterium]MCX7589728.1 PBP1A family penicillin-binding protein [Patescibacteria group bacterium]MDW8279913.1 PBP1A family penicillin-binding protein [bacterium]